MANYVKKEENAGKNGNLIEPSDENEIVMMKKGIGSDGAEGGETGEPQWQKCGKYRKYRLKKYLKEEENAGKKGYLIEPGDENKIETMKKDLGSDGDEAGETGAPKRMRYENSKPNTNMTNATGIGSSNSNNDVDNNILKRTDKNENKMIGNNVEHAGENPCKTRATQQQQKCGKSTPIDVADDDVDKKDPAKEKQRLAKIAKKQQQKKNWKNAKKNHNVIEYMHFTELATDQSHEIHFSSFWCYFDPHENTTRMSNDLQLTKNINTTTPVTIAPAKERLRNINKKIKIKYRNWLSVQNTRKYYLKILELILEGEEKAYKFQEQQEAAAVEAKRWEKKRVKKDNKKYRRKKE